MITCNASFKGSDGHTYRVERTAPEAFPAQYKPVVPDSWPLGAGLHGDLEQAWKALFDGCKARKVKLTPVTRTPSEIAREIARNWAAHGRIYFGAVPYLDAMRTLQGKDDAYGLDSAQSIIVYFLANANSYRGAVAKAHKEELKALSK